MITALVLATENGVDRAVTYGTDFILVVIAVVGAGAGIVRHYHSKYGKPIEKKLDQIQESQAEEARLNAKYRTDLEKHLGWHDGVEVALAGQVDVSGRKVLAQ